jgi:putative isomerase
MESLGRRLGRVKATGILALLIPAGVLAAYGQTARYTYTGKIQFDIRRVPFSRFGSWLSISDMSQFQLPYREDGIFLRTLHHGGISAFRIELINSAGPVPITAVATPTLLTLSGGGGTVQISFEGPDRLRIHGSGIRLRLVADEGMAVPYPAKRWEINTSAMKYMLSPLHGSIEESMRVGDNPERGAIVTLGGASKEETFDDELDAYISVWNSRPSEETFDQVQQAEQAAWSAWLRTMPPVDGDLGPGAELAAYVSWESVVEPSGNLKRPAMLMSKNWMGSIWSWDQTFNAMATSFGNPQLAWDQFMLPIDVQDAHGAFPDMWNADSIVWTYSKPPIHGWALAWMLRHNRFRDQQHLAAVYEPLVKWTEWYFRYRDLNGNGLPEYRHGDESGWDNSTALIDGTPVESPDLSAYLVLQMDTLSEIANHLGKTAEAQQWKQRSDALLQKLLQRFWTGHEFVSFSITDRHPIHSESLLLLMPVVLGHRLPPSVQTRLIEDLCSRLRLSPFGLPSEPPSSPLYQPDGYWRGPIWAPATMIVAEGLDDMGEHTLADTLRKKFCLMAQRSGMAENFDARTGAALRDPAYTWTSSVYLIFAAQLAHTLQPSRRTEHARNP